MGTEATKILRATLCEIERGVFYATYFHGDVPLVSGALPTFKLGVSALDVRRRIERDARALGYGTISWTPLATMPMFPAEACCHG